MQSAVGRIAFGFSRGKGAIRQCPINKMKIFQNFQHCKNVDKNDSIRLELQWQTEKCTKCLCGLQIWRTHHAIFKGFLTRKIVNQDKNNSLLWSRNTSEVEWTKKEHVMDKYWKDWPGFKFMYLKLLEEIL